MNHSLLKNSGFKIGLSVPHVLIASVHSYNWAFIFSYCLKYIVKIKSTVFLNMTNKIQLNVAWQLLQHVMQVTYGSIVLE